MVLKLNKCFGDHMVLQRNKKVTLWGIANHNQTVKIQIQGQNISTQANSNGQFFAELKPLATSFNETLIVKTDQEQLIFHDVAIGEVWLCGGQSNMEFPMGYDCELEKEKKSCPNNLIRYFDYPEVSYTGEIKEFNYDKTFGFWRKCTVDNLKYFSAVGYYFAKKLNEKIPNTPIGLLACNWGGTLISCWMDKETLIKSNGKKILDDYQEQLNKITNLKEYQKNYKLQKGNIHTSMFQDPVTNWIMTGTPMSEVDQKLAKQGKKRETWLPQQIGPYSERRPNGLYETMLKHVAPYTIRGVLWYQGEADAKYADIYQKQLVNMIKLWRNLFKDENLPFLIVQLAPFIHQFGDWGNNWPIIRQAQQWVTDNIPYTALAVITDSGMKMNIHPLSKRNVGYRLAYQALNKIYDQKQLCEAPTLIKAIKKHQKLKLYFDNVGEGLHLDNSLEWIDGLEIIDHEKIYDHLPIKKIDKEYIILDSTGLDDLKHFIVSICEKDYYCMNLKNSAGIPVRPCYLSVTDK